MVIKPDDKRVEFLAMRKSGGLTSKRKCLSTGFPNMDELAKLVKGYLSIWSGYPGSGKALAIDTPILSIEGWKTMGSLVVGDTIFDDQGKQCRVIRATEVMYDHECFEMEFSDGGKIIADAEHRWFTTTSASRTSERASKRTGRATGRPLKKKGVDQTNKQIVHSVKTTTEIASSLYAENGKRLNHAIPFQLEVDLPERNDLLIHPYALGAWLGDGRTDYASITDAEGVTTGRMAQLGYSIRKQPSGKHQYGIINGFVGLLKKEGLLGNKHIPEKYLRGSIEQRYELLRGLMDSDGYISQSGHCEYCTVRRELAEGFVELATSLGIQPKINTGRAMLYGKDCGIKYRVLFHPKGKRVFYSKRQEKVASSYRSNMDLKFISSCNPCSSVPVRCIEVDSPSHLYLAGKTLIPTHNTEFLDAVLLNMSLMHGWKVMYYSPENHPVEEHMTKLAEKFIGKHISEFKEAEELSSLDFLQKHFTWMYPEDPKLDTLLGLATKEHEQNGIDALVIDPWNAVTHHRGGELIHEYLSEALSKMIRFGRGNNVFIAIVAHPTKPQKDKDGNFPVPTLYDISDGAMWRNKADYGFICHRADMSKNELDVYVQKVKYKWMGKVGMTRFDYNYRNGRFKSPEEKDFWLPTEVVPPF